MYGAAAIFQKSPGPIGKNTLYFGNDGHSNFIRRLRANIESNGRVHTPHLLLGNRKSLTGEFVQHLVKPFAGTEDSDIRSFLSKKLPQHIAVVFVIVRHQHTSSVWSNGEIAINELPLTK